MLTARTIDQTPPGDQRYELSDSRGLVLRVTPCATKTWCAYVYHDGRRRRVTLGRYPELGLRAARRERDRLRTQLADAESMTFRALAQLYLEDARARKRSWAIDARLLQRQIIPARTGRGGRNEFGDLELPRIGRGEVLDVTHPITKRGATEQAARVHAVLRSVLAYAVRRGLIATNPAAAAGIRQRRPRDRVMTAAELAAWWPWVRATVPPAPRITLELVLATGARLAEVVGLVDAEIDAIDRTWTLPAERSKNGIAHALPLSSWALSLVDEALDRWPDRPKLIPTSADTVRRYMKASVDAAGIARATPHDVRRTVATELARAGADRQVVDRILGHVDASTGAIYDRYGREQEQREALEAWSERFAAIVNESTAIPHPSSTPTHSGAHARAAETPLPNHKG